jgi:glycosyltransferase involved in cell wall biosynthesis
MRVALVHDWITGLRGGEKVLEVLSEQHPGADLFTLVSVPGAGTASIERLRRHASFVQRLPGAGRYYRQYLPLFPTAVELFDLDGFDLVISTSHCAAKSVVVTGRARHVCYCFTPMRYAWDQFSLYFGAERIGRLGSAGARRVMQRLARWDAATAGRVHRYVAISHYVASRIRRYYNRHASVVYPPVDTGFFRPDGRSPETYVLIVSALVPYKRLDVAIEGARRVGRPIRIVGDGPDRARLAAVAGGHAELLGTRSNDEIRELYRGAAAFVLTGEEDFGIAPLEAQACGRPVVALARGGALETVVPDETGLLVEAGTPEAFGAAFRELERRTFDAGRIRVHAERFSRERFARQIAAAIDETASAPPGVRW